LPTIFSQPHTLGSELGKAATLQAIQGALYTLELTGLKFVIEASRRLALEPATMCDILRYASARSAPSMTEHTSHRSGELEDMEHKLSDFASLGEEIGSPTPVTRCALAAVKRWWEDGTGYHSSAVVGSPTVWDFASSEPTRPLGLERRQRVLVVGLGVMGLGMAVSLAKSFDVTGCDVSAERLAEAQAHALSTTDDVGSCLEETDFLLFVVEKFEQIMGILDKAAAALASRTRPLTLIAHSTMSPSSAMVVRDRISELNNRLSFLEAPISGGPARAMRGELLVYFHPFPRNDRLNLCASHLTFL
jgi:3-hydroxyisobutyrate dehydrogenase-like beta-hydroxyacid dehydrogenase